ncbi:MAG TPA: hypothetical protein VHX36_04570 [Candidatus Acidoferrales bacterium]|nr:hypothetical protein [Candidatus Acidoferrales bacterium]
MWSLIVWQLSLALRAIILIRGFSTKALRKFPYFYVYILSAVLGDLFVYWTWKSASQNKLEAYQHSYWIAQFLTLLIGCGIVLEIFKHILAPYPGADKFATAVVLGSFAAIFCVAIIYQLVAPGGSAVQGTTFVLERDVRTVQAVFLFGILAVISYYRIPIGRNLKGMISGYGIYIVTSLFTLAARAYAGPRFNSTWNVIQPFSFDLSLVIWAVALWSYQPNPAPDPAVPLEEDYEALARKTKRTLASVWSHLRP